MKTVTKIITVIAQVLVVAIAVIIGLRVLCWTIFAVLPQDVADRIRTKTRVALRLPMGLEKPLSQEGLAANQDHSAVAWWIIQCLGSPDMGRIPGPVQDLLAGYPNDTVEFTNSNEPPISVPRPYIRIAQLSSEILHRRIAIDDRVSKAYALAQIGALTAILIGLLTTVLVALSSSDFGKQQTRTALTIRIGALVSPALGTAAAAVIAFYDPNGTLARQSQVAAGLQQLHAQISNAVWSLTPIAKPEDPVPSDFAARLDAWTQRYQELIASIGDSRITADAQRKSGASPSASPSDSRTASDAERKSNTQEKQK